MHQSYAPAPRSGGLAGAGAAAGAARLKGFHCRPTGASVPLFARGTTSRASPPLALGATADVGRSFPPLPPSFPPDFSLRPAPSSTSKVGTAADTGRRRPMGRPVLCVRCIETGAACAEVSEELGASLSIVLSAFFLRRLKERKSPAPREGASGNGACPPFCCGDSSACGRHKHHSDMKASMSMPAGPKWYSGRLQLHGSDNLVGYVCPDGEV